MNKVKICGITNIEDALLCAKLKVDFIGFIFYKKSPRFIDPEDAKDICKMLANFSIKKVGVFVDESSSYINSIGEKVNLDYVQLHGEESPNLIEEIKLETIKAFSISSKRNKDFEKYNSKYWLFDTFDKDFKGGTGKSFDWSLISEIADREKIILSGGLNLENIGNAIKESKTSFFDICSGVEKSPGVKDVQKLETIVGLIKSWART